jgi:excisionase family DNA binding protein
MADREAWVVSMTMKLTPTEVCDILQVSKTTLYTWARSGLIPAFRVGSQWRFDADALEAWLKEDRPTITEGMNGRKRPVDPRHILADGELLGLTKAAKEAE